MFWDPIVDLLRLAIIATAQPLGGNLGVGIFVTSVLFRALLFPLTLRMTRGSLVQQRAMKELQPELERIRKRYVGQPNRITEATQQLFAKHGMSAIPAGCLGGLAQMPLALGFYSAVRKVADMGGQFGWIANIAKPDMLLTILVSAITLGTITYSTSGAATTEGRNLMLLVVPVLFTAIVLGKTSAGVAIYWGVTSLASLLQTYFARRSLRTAP